NDRRQPRSKHTGELAAERSTDHRRDERSRHVLTGLAQDGSRIDITFRDLARGVLRQRADAGAEGGTATDADEAVRLASHTTTDSKHDVAADADRLQPGDDSRRAFERALAIAHRLPVHLLKIGRA